MISNKNNKKRKYLERINFKRVKLSENLILTTSQKFVGFRNIKTDKAWSFKRLRDTAGPIAVNGFQISLGLPQMTQTCWPGQTIRINTGWQLSDIGETQMMHSYPDGDLLQYDIIGFPNIYDRQMSGTGQYVMPLLNSGPLPVVFDVHRKGLQSQINVYRYDPETNLMTENLTDFNWGQFANAALGIAQKVIPIFL